MKEYYKILDLDESASIDELNEHYRNKIKQFHPDLFACDKNKEKLAIEKTKHLNIAYSELKKILIEKEKNRIKHPENKMRHQSEQSLLKEGKALLEAVGHALKNLSGILLSENTKFKKKDSQERTQTKPSHKSSPSFDEVLLKKIKADQSKPSGKPSYSKSYQDMLRKRSSYGSRQQEGQSGKGPISPISGVKGIRGERIE